MQSASEVSTIATGQGSVVVADIHGQLHLCSPDFDVIKTWTAHVDGRVTHAKYAGTKGILVTLGVSLYNQFGCSRHADSMLLRKRTEQRILYSRYGMLETKVHRGSSLLEKYNMEPARTRSPFSQ